MMIHLLRRPQWTIGKKVAESRGMVEVRRSRHSKVNMAHRMA